MELSKTDLIDFFKKKRSEFGILDQKINGKNLVYVDNSATTQKPSIVIDSLVNYYTSYNSNVHRGIHTLSQKATDAYESVRGKVASFINCENNEVVFTKGTTEGLNMLAFGLMKDLKSGDEIVISSMEHHANMVPWQEVAKRTGAKLKVIPIDDNYEIDMNKAKVMISDKTKIVSVCHVSNVLGTINPVEDLARLAHENGAIFIVDGAQSAPHMKIDVKKLDCDFFVLSSHKMCGPTGVGVLYGKLDCLEKLDPFMFGGDMIGEVSFNSSTYANLPYRLEAGTPNIADVIAFGKALDYLLEIGMDNIEAYEHLLVEYFMKKVSEVSGITIYGPKEKSRSGVFSFTINGIHSHDVSTIMDKYGIAIRGGHHCAMPLIALLGVSSVSRISLYFYNTTEEIDYIVEVLKKLPEEFEKGDFLLN